MSASIVLPSPYKIYLDFCAIQYIPITLLLFSLLLFSPMPSHRVQEMLVPLWYVCNSYVTVRPKLV